MAPTLRLPVWTDSYWGDSSNLAVENVCEQRLTKAEAVARLRAQFTEYAGADLVTAEQLWPASIRARARNPPEPAFSVLYVFLLTSDTMGGILLRHDAHGNIFNYVFLDEACQLHRLGSLSESFDRDDCARFQGVPLFYMPDLLDEFRACYPTSGCYVFDTTSLVDTCHHAQLPITNVISYEQRDATHARFFFPVPPAGQLDQVFELKVADGVAGGSELEPAGMWCGPFEVGWQAKLQPPGLFDFKESDAMCYGDYYDECTFQIAGATLYGPLF